MADKSPSDIQDLLPAPSYGDPKKMTDAHKGKIKKFFNSAANYLAVPNRRRLARQRKADEFFGANQWLVASYTGYSAQFSTTWTRLAFDRDDPNYIPTPVFDEYSPAILNEAARLGKPDYEPYVQPEGVDPDIKVKEACEISEAALRQALVDMNFQDEQDRGLHHMPQYGGWALLSYWDMSWEKTVRVPIKDAMKCPNPECNFTLASSDLDPDMAQAFMMAHPDEGSRITATQQPMTPARVKNKPVTSYALSVCLKCNTHMIPGTAPDMALESTPPAVAKEGDQPQDSADGGFTDSPQGIEFDPTDPTASDPTDPRILDGPPDLIGYTPAGDALNQFDFFKRPLGEDMPLGEWKLRTLTPDEVFYRDYGLRVYPGKIDEFTIVTVETLNYIRNRYPAGGLVEPESAKHLLEFHPIYGEREMYENATAGVNAFRHHARLKQHHRQPAMQLWRDANGEPEKDAQGKKTGRMVMDRGRSVVMAGDVLLYDGDYLMESQANPGEWVPRCNLDYATFDLRSGGKELEGVSLAERMWDAQEYYNETWSQIMDCQQMKGTPKWLATPGMTLSFENAGGAGGIYTWKPDPLSPTIAPKEIDNELMNVEVYQSLDRVQKYLQRSLTDVESGNVPTGVTAALALQILAEQSNEKRRPRIRRIKEMLQRQFFHGLVLLHELAVEARPAWVKGDDDEEKQISWKGQDLFVGQVKIEAEPDQSSDLVRQQTVRDMLNDYPQLLQDPRARRAVADIMRAPKELFERQDLQEEQARREFSEFVDGMVEPVIDEDIDDDDAHADRHGIDCMSPKWRAMEQEANWNGALVYLSDWRKIFEQGKTIPVTPEQQTQYQKSMADYNARAQQAQRAQQPFVGPDGQPVPPPQAPQPTQIPPMSQQFDDQNMPALLELRIMKCWKIILMENQFIPTPVQPSTAKGVSVGDKVDMTPEPLRQVMRFRAHLAAHVIYAEQKKAAAAGGATIQAAPGSSQETAAGTIPNATEQPQAAQPGVM